ncbi:MAG: hypothetical protein RLZZ202_285, partial [Pseudomonadota bacterium]
PMFNGQELLELVDLATYVAVNDYEGEMLCQRTGLSLHELANRLEALIVTKGAQGAQIHAQGKVIDIPAVPAQKIADPTGCGDAFRGGLIKIAHQGPQNHQPTRAEISDRFKAAFGTAITL